MPNKKSDFDIDKLLSTEQHEQDLQKINSRLAELEMSIKKIATIEAFGDYFGTAVSKSKIVNDKIEKVVDQFLYKYTPQTKRTIKKIVDEINKDNTWFKLGLTGQFIIQLIITVIIGVLIAFLTSKFGIN